MKTSVGTRSTAGIEACLRLACLMEATARKPGNVHPQVSFDDLCYADFVCSAGIVAPILSKSGELGVGRAVCQAVTRTAEVVGRNTNLGSVLLLAPLAAVPADVSLSEGIGSVLDRLTQADASFVYRAIRLAQPGGMGTVPEQDVAVEPTGTLLEVMRMAAGRDLIAAQYANGFDIVLRTGVPILEATANFAQHWEDAVIGLHLRLMARHPDTLIARRCGLKEARQSAALAGEVLEAGWPDTHAGRRKLEQLDKWLRHDGHRRNPGTTADLVTACLFAAQRDARIDAADWA